MGISNNAPTMSYIHISGTSVVWNNETYMVQDFATNKRYIYWNADTPHQLNASNVMPNRSTKQYLVIVNDNGMHSLVPSTSDDFSISFEGNSNQAIKDRIFGLYEKNEHFGNKFVAIEENIDGIKSVIGTTEETPDGTLVDRISKVEQSANEINLSVEEISKKYNDDKETNKLREDLNSSIIKLNSTLGTFKSELTDYFKDNEISSEEQIKIKTQLGILTSEKATFEGYIDIVKLIAESNNQTQDVVAIESAKKALQIAHDNLHNNVTNAVIDSIITPTENTIIIDSFAKYNLKINELKNTCDDIIILGVGGVITEELANISIKSNEIKLSVSKVEEDFKNDMSIQKLELEGQIRDVNSALGTFEETVNTTFKDGIIDESEKSLLKEKINLIDKEKVDIDLRYNSIYSDTNLSTDIKSELKLKYNNYSNKHSELKSKIESVISDSLINDTEKKEVDTLFKQYANTLAYFHDVINKAIENIAFNSSNAELKKAKEELQNEVSDVSDSVNDLSDTMHGAFQDGILSESEKIAIRQNLSILASEKSDIDKQYATIYANADLTGTPKTNLKTAYDNYVVSYNSLISTINTILGKSSTVNSTDRNNLTNAFNTHNTKLGLYTVSANNALDSIAKKKAEVESAKVDKKYAEIILDPETGIKSMVGHLTQKIDGEGGIEQRLQTAEQTITSEGITNIVKDSQFIKDLNGKVNTNINKISKVEQTANEISSEVSDLSGGFSKLQQNVNGLTSTVAGKVDSSSMSSIIQQSSKDIQIGFNGINDTILIDPNKMQFKDSAGNQSLSFMRGSLYAYEPNSSVFIGAGLIPRWNQGLYNAGFGVLAGANSYYYSIARANSWGADTQANPGAIDEYFIINYRDRGSDLSQKQGCHTYYKLYTSGGINGMGYDIENFANIKCLDLYAGTIKDTNGSTILTTNGSSIASNKSWNFNYYTLSNVHLSNASLNTSQDCSVGSISTYTYKGSNGTTLFTSASTCSNRVGWAWNNNNLLDPVIIGGSYGYSITPNTDTYSNVKTCNDDVNLDGILDKINIYPAQSTYKTNSERSLEIDVTELRESENADMFIKRHDTVNSETGESEIVENIDMKSMLHLALLEIKNLKEEVKVLKQKVNV